MRYLHVNWFHDDPDEPIELFSEVDDGSWELRKVEVYRDGRVDFADAEESSGSTRLGLEPIPSLDELNADPEFQAREIASDVFESRWAMARRSAHTPVHGGE